MRFEWLRYLKAVVEYGSMSKASEVLFCSQPTITNAIKSIEDTLGAPVLNRTKKGIVSLTPLGEIVLQDTDFILGYEEKWKQLAKSNADNHPIRVMLTGTAPRYYIINCIMRMKQEHPSWDVRLKYASTSRGGLPFSRMSSGDIFRFGISYRVPADLKKSVYFAQEHGMRIAILQKEEFYVFYNAKSSLASLQREIAWSDIHGKEVLLYQNPNDFPYLKHLHRAGCRMGPQVWQEENMMIALSINEKTVAFRPKSTGDHNIYVSGGLVKMSSIESGALPVNLCLFYPGNEQITSLETEFLNCFKQFFPSFEPLDPSYDFVH